MLAQPRSPGRSRRGATAGLAILGCLLAAAAPAAAEPRAETTGSPVRTATSIRFDARVDPNGAATTYRFEYGTSGPCASNPCASTAPAPAGSGDLTRLVSAEVGGLQPGTTYHYRVIAEGDGTAVGEDMVLKTRGGSSPSPPGRFPGPPESDRSWELVSAPDSGGNPVFGGEPSGDGERATYTVEGGTPTSEYGFLESPHYAERTGSGWREAQLAPPRSESLGPFWTGRDGPADFSFFVAANTGSARASLWRLGFGDAPVRLLTLASPQVFDGWHATADDGSRVLALIHGGALDPLHPEAAAKPNLYEVGDGAPRLVSLLPDGSAAPCGVGGSDGAYGMANPAQHPLSSDGRLIFFPSRGADCGGESGLYVSDLEAGVTKLVAGPSFSGPSCGAAFLRSTAAAVFFWTKSRLAAEDSEPATCASTTPPADGDVYRFDLGDEALECVTCVAPGQDADVYVDQTAFEGATRNLVVSEDGSRIYFQSPHSLVAGAPAVPGGENLYRLDVDGGDLAWVGGPGVTVGSQNPLTADGSVLYLLSSSPALNPLGGLDNGGTAQYYRYDDRDRSLVCVSCPQDGSSPRPLAMPWLRPAMGDERGDFVFDTPTPLAAADVNTAAPGEPAANGNDVYEWRDGRLLLVSDGATSWPVEMGWPQAMGMSDSGRDVFFLEAARLTWEADDAFERLWDARVGGGFAQPQSPAPCVPESCFVLPSPPDPEATPPTLTFNGPGNRKRRHRSRGHRRHRSPRVDGRIAVARPDAERRARR